MAAGPAAVGRNIPEETPARPFRRSGFFTLAKSARQSTRNWSAKLKVLDISIPFVGDPRWLHARYSPDNQRDASIEDQLRICREQAKREKWRIVATYKDAAISGASMILRPGIQTLLRDAQARQFDIVLAEALDRISRDQADIATLFKHLKFAGVPIVTLAEGEISELHVGLKA